MGEMNIIEELEKLKIEHSYVKDDYYFGCDIIDGNKCTCGADEHNERLEKVIKAIRGYFREHGVK